jgi:hypothetical protein
VHHSAHLRHGVTRCHTGFFGTGLQDFGDLLRVLLKRLRPLLHQPGIGNHCIDERLFAIEATDSG